jgi:multiple sugar transport system permease protein
MSVLQELRQIKKAGGAQAGRSDKGAHWWMAPWALGFVAITAIPMFASLYFAFTRFNLLQAPTWHGVQNFIDLAGDSRFHQSLRVTFTFALVGVPLQLAVALAIAVLMDRGMKGLSFYRSALYLPSMMGGSVAISILWRQVFGTNGLLNTVLTLVGLGEFTQGWISHPDTALWTIILLHVWTFGSPMIIFLAGLRNIPRMYYEAAEVDGASAWRRFRSITLPLLSPIILFNLVLQTINAFQTFTQAFIVSGGTGGPADSTLFTSLLIYQRAFIDFRMGNAAAMAWIILIIIAAASGLIFFTSKWWVHYDE